MTSNGTLVGSPTFTAGKFGNAMDVGVGKGCSLPNNGPLQFTADAPFCIEFRYRSASPPTTGTGVIISCAYFLGADQTTGKFVDGNGNVSGPNICDNAWHAIVWNYDGTTFRTYVDGTMTSSVVASYAAIPSGTAETVGTGFNGVTTYDWPGSIDELCISNIPQYTGSSYTPATAPFANNRAGVVALYHFESDATDSFDPTPPATKLAITTQPPGSTATGAPFALAASVEDASSAVVSGSTASVSIAISTNPGSGTLSGTTTMAAAAGIATFTGLSINNAGTGYTLVVTSTGLTSATSSAFDITTPTPTPTPTPTATKCVVTTQPPGSTTAAAPFGLVVSIEDAGSSIVSGDTSNVSITIGTNPASGTLSGTATVAAVGGIATFTGLSINNAGTGYTLVASSGALATATSSPFNITAALAPLARSGNLFVTSVAPGQVQLTANVTGGTGTLVYKWYKSPTVNFVPGSGNLLANGSGISGATTATLTDTTALVAGTPAYYVCNITDTSTGNVTFPHRPVYLGLPTIQICTIGDSTSLYTSPWTQLFLQVSRGVRLATTINQAASGSDTTMWWTGGAAQPNLTAALAACGGSFAGFFVLIRLGVNDAQNARAASAVSANLAGLVAYVIAHGGIPFLSYPTWREPGSFGQQLPGTVLTFDESTTPFLLQYHAAIDSIIDGTTVFPGDKTSYALFAELPQTYMAFNPPTYTFLTDPGAIHPNDTGSQAFGYAEAAAVLAYLYPASSGGGSSVALAADGLDAITIESGINARQALSLLLGTLAGRSSGATGGASTIVFKDPANTHTRISANVDANGNRTSITVTPPA